MRALNTLRALLSPKSIAAVEAAVQAPASKGGTFNDKITAKVDKVLEAPEASAKKIRSSIRRGQYPFVTVKQLRVQWNIAARNRDYTRKEALESVMDSLYQQEVADGFEGTLGEALYYLENFVSPGAVISARADALFHTYTNGVDGVPFIGIPELTKARKAAEDKEDVALFQSANSVLEALESSTRELLCEFNDPTWVEQQSSEAVLAHCHTGTDALFTA